MTLKAFTILELVIVMLLLVAVYSFGYQAVSILRLKSNKLNEVKNEAFELLFLKSALEKDLNNAHSFYLTENKEHLILSDRQNAIDIEFEFLSNQVIRHCSNGSVIKFELPCKVDIVQNVEAKNFCIIPAEIEIQLQNQDSYRINLRKIYSAEEIHTICSGVYD